MTGSKRMVFMERLGMMILIAVICASCGSVIPTVQPDVQDLSVESFLKAVERRDIKTVEHFIKQGMDVNAREDSERNALWLATRNDDANMVQTLIQAGADLNARYRYGYSIFHVAVEWDSPAAAEVLINAGVDLEAKTEQGKTPLFISASLGKKTTPLLIRAGADPNTANNDGETALMTAALTGELESIRMLVEAKANVNTADRIGRAALINAAGMLRSSMESFKVEEQVVTAMVEVLLSAGADVNAKTKNEGDTALHAAAKEGHTDAAALLIKAGAKVNAKTKLDKYTPLMEAAKDGNAELVKLLLKSGAKRKIKDRLGRTAAKWGSDHSEIVAILGGKLSRKAAKAKKVSPKQKEKAGKRLYELGYRTYDESMFVMSAHKGDLEAAKAFLDYGQNIESKDPRDHATTPLLAASMTPRSPELGIFLIKAGANVNVKDVNGSTPLIWAAEKCGMKDLVKALVKAGADVNAKAAGGATPLMMAESFKCNEIVKILKKAGARK